MRLILIDAEDGKTILNGWAQELAQESGPEEVCTTWEEVKADLRAAVEIGALKPGDPVYVYNLDELMQPTTILYAPREL